MLRRSLLALVFLLVGFVSGGCAGALWVTDEHTVLPLAWGNAEIVTDEVSACGGPISDGMVGAAVEIVRLGLSFVVPALAPTNSVDQETEDTARCLQGSDES